VTEASRAVFLSYASQDVDAVQRICDALRAGGIEVWFDKSELRGGDAWDRSIRQQIHDCALFVPIISGNTASRSEGYFRLEWALADQRTQMMARNKPFIVPVCVDATPDTGADVPDSFLRVQWTRLPEGEIPRGFCQRIASLLGTAAMDPAPAGAAPLSPPGAGVPFPGAAPARKASAPTRVRLVTAILVAAGVLAALIAWQPWRMFTGTPAAHGPEGSGAPASRPEKSIAVLPFADLSEKKDQEYFADGLAEELIDALTRVPNLRVPARTSSFSFKAKPTTVGEIARTLGVTHVLEGSVRKSGDHMRITAQLVRADNGFHLWSQTYDRDVRDIFAVQDDIARAVVERLRVTLLGSEAVAPKQPIGIEAHNLYLEARYLTGRDTAADLDRAVLQYQKALALEPNYAPAWAWLAYCHVLRVGQGLDTTGAGFSKATNAARRAIAIDPQLPEPYVMLAIAHMQYDLDWKAASEALTRAMALDPNNALGQQSLGLLSVAVGRMSDALTHFRRAIDGDPLDLLHSKFLGRALHYGGHPAESVAVLRHAIELNPQFPGLHYELGRALLQQGDPQAARAAFEAEADAAWRSFGLPIGYLVTHRDAQARAALAALVEHSAGSEFQVAETFAFFGETEKSFQWLERARTLHDPGIIWSRRDPFLASIVADPRYRAFLQKVGMPPVSKDD
jgi:TolB-like protein/Tfp pilus assembly protein PilF